MLHVTLYNVRIGTPGKAIFLKHTQAAFNTMSKNEIKLNYYTAENNVISLLILNSESK